MSVAREMGAAHTVLVKSQDAQTLAAEVANLMGSMPDIAIECSGAESSIATAIYVSFIITLCLLITTIVVLRLLYCLRKSLILGMKLAFNHQHLQILISNLTNMSNFQALEVVDRGNETQLKWLKI